MVNWVDIDVVEGCISNYYRGRLLPCDASVLNYSKQQSLALKHVSWQHRHWACKQRPLTSLAWALASEECRDWAWSGILRMNVVMPPYCQLQRPPSLRDNAPCYHWQPPVDQWCLLLLLLHTNRRVTDLVQGLKSSIQMNRCHLCSVLENTDGCHLGSIPWDSASTYYC